jgi:multiple sugar transport system permease protein
MAAIQAQSGMNKASFLDDERFLGGVMLLPAVIYIILLIALPFIFAIILAFSDATVGTPQIDRLTLDTFRAVIGSTNFRIALFNTFVFTFVSQIIMVILANILAVALSANFPGKWFVRLLILLPWATPIAIGSLGWLWIFDSVYSPIDWAFRIMGLLGHDGWLQHWGIAESGIIKPSSNMYWLGESGLARFAVIVVYVWRMLPMSTVIIMAGLTSIPTDVKDAVAVDGVSWWTEFTEVTIPLLRPILIVAFLFGIIFTFTDMTVIFVLTQGGPINSTHVLASRAFYTGIEGGALAEGAATAIFMLPVLLGVAMIMLRIARRSEVS